MIQKEGFRVPLPPLPSAPVSPSVGPLGRFLLHPGGTQKRWIDHLARLAACLEHPALVIAVAGLVVAALWFSLREVQQRRWVHGGRWLSILPPAQPAPGSGLALWQLLHPLLSSQPGLAGRRPPVGFEIVAGAAGLRIGLWISRTLPADAVAQAITSACPGAHVSIGGVPAAMPPRTTTGGQGRLSLPDWFPLATQAVSAADPMRALLDALIGCEPGERAMVQVLVRPATGRRLLRARRAAAVARGGGSRPRVWPLGAGRRPAAGRPPGPVDPVASADVRDITAKVITGPHFQVAIRFAVNAGGDWQGRRRPARLTQLRAGLGLFTGRNQLTGRRLARPAAVLAGRRLRQGFLLSAAELAALAHLPAEPARYGLPSAPAHQVAPPREISHA